MKDYSITVTGSFIEPTVVKIDKDTMATDIIRKLCHSGGIQEYIWFGIEFTDKDGKRSSVNIADPMIGLGAMLLSTPSENIELKLMYYPPSYETILESRIRRMMMEDSLKKVTDERVYAPPEMILDFVAHHLQVTNGDMGDLQDAEVSKLIAKSMETQFPAGIKSRYGVNQAEWESGIKSMWMALRGFHPHDVVDSFLGQMEELQMHNVHYFDIKNKKQTPLVVGVEATGICILHPEDLQTPKISFEWSNISRLEYRDSSLILTIRDSDAQHSENSKLEFKTAGQAQGYRIGASVRGFYNNFLNYYRYGQKLRPPYDTMRDAAMRVHEKEQAQKKLEIAESMEKTTQKLKESIEEAKKIDSIAAKRAEVFVGKIIKNEDSTEQKAEELYEQLKNVNKLTSKGVNDATRMTVTAQRKTTSTRDTIYDDQRSKQISKLSTLALLRAGSLTKARVELFESI